MRDRSALVLLGRGPARTLPAEGRLDDAVWSPDGRWLLVSWPAADQWIFLRTPRVRGIVTISHVAREFDPGGAGAGGFPRVEGWVEEVPSAAASSG